MPDQSISDRVYALIFNGITKGTADFMALSSRERLAEAVYAELRAGNIEFRLGPLADLADAALTENARREIEQLTRMAADTSLPPSERVKRMLTIHQRRDAGSCLCGWDKLGGSHPGHQAQVLADAGLIAETTEDR